MDFSLSGCIQVLLERFRLSSNMIEPEELNNILSDFPLKDLHESVENAYSQYEIFELTRLHYIQILQSIANSEAGEKLNEMIKNWGLFKEYDNPMIIVGRGGHTIGKWAIAQWLVFRAAMTTPEQTVQELQQYLNEEYNAGLEILAINGIGQENGDKIPIYEDIFLAPLKTLPSSIYKYSLEKSQFRIDRSIQEAMVKSVLVRETKFAPKFIEEAGANSLSEIESDLNYEKMADICRCFTLLNSACPTPVLYWTQLLDRVPGSQTISGSAGNPILDVMHGPQYKMTHEDYLRLASYIELFMNLNPRDQEVFRLVIDRINQAKRRSNFPDKVLDTVIALETMLLKGKKDRMQLGLSLRLHGAWFLGKSLDERLSVFKDLRDLYDLRSKVAHKGQFEIKNDSDKIKKEALLNRGINIASSTVIGLMKNGWPNWNEIILGSDQFVGE